MERISSRIALPRIIESTNRIRKNHASPPRWSIPQRGELVQVRIVKEDSVGSSNRHLTVPLRIPCESQPRCKMQPGIRRELLVGNSCVAWEQESCRSILKDRAPAPLIEPIVLEM